MLWTYISKRNCGAEIEEKKSDNGITKIAGKKSDKLIFGNSIAEIDHNKVICGNCQKHFDKLIKDTINWALSPRQKIYSLD